MTLGIARGEQAALENSAYHGGRPLPLIRISANPGRNEFDLRIVRGSYAFPFSKAPSPLYENVVKTTIPANRGPLNRGDSYSSSIRLLSIMAGLFIACF